MLERDNTLLVVIDVQERMLPAIDGNQNVLDGILRLIAGCRELAIPMLVTEQYSKGLGPTVAPVAGQPDVGHLRITSVASASGS